MSENSQPSPALVMNTLTRYQDSMALKGALDLDLFTQIGAEGASAAEAAQRCSASERGTRILCDYLTVLGLLTKSDGRYGLTQDSAVFLNKQSPAYMGDARKFLLAPRLR